MKRFRDSYYLIGENGEVYSEKTKRFLKPWKTRVGYWSIKFTTPKGHFAIHRLVAETYCSGFDINLDVNHIDGNKLNNHFSNLEWCTRSHNLQHSYDNNLSKRRFGHKDTVGSKNSMAVLNETLVKEIREKYGTGEYTYSELGRFYKVDPATIGYVCKRHTWKHVD